MAATSQTALAQTHRTASSPVPRRVLIAILAIVAATSGVVTTAFALSLAGRPAPISAPGLAPGSRDDHFRDGRATTVSGNVGDKWYLEQAPGSADRIRDAWYRE